MQQYQRASEKEFERLLMKDFHEEQEDNQLEIELLREDYFDCDKEGYLYFGYNQRVADKVERVMTEMREDLGDLEEYVEYRESEGMI